MSIPDKKKRAQHALASRKAERRARPRLAALALPEDVTGGEARIILIGSERALIENHRGLVELAPERVRLMTRVGIIAVTGANLRVVDVRNDALSVVGRISGVIFPQDNDGGRA